MNKKQTERIALLLGRLGMKAAEALPGIIGAIISWVLNKFADVVGWVSQHLWALVEGIEGLPYTCMVTKKVKIILYDVSLYNSAFKEI